MSVTGLNVEDRSTGRVLIDSVNLKIHRLKIGAIIGESGAGKTLLARSLVGLLAANLNVRSGRFYYRGRQIGYQNLGNLRGGKVFYAPQGAGASLNPSLKISGQLRESSKLDMDDIEQILQQLGFRDPKKILNAYSFQLSEGECQRCLLAMAIAAGPELLILDEPAASLDINIQHELMDILKTLPDIFEMSVLAITHNLSLISGVADDVLVMWKGRVVENGSLTRLINSAKHPYTRRILQLF